MWCSSHERWLLCRFYPDEMILWISYANHWKFLMGNFRWFQWVFGVRECRSVLEVHRPDVTVYWAGYFRHQSGATLRIPHQSGGATSARTANAAVSFRDVDASAFSSCTDASTSQLFISHAPALVLSCTGSCSLVHILNITSINIMSIHHPRYWTDFASFIQLFVARILRDRVRQKSTH